MSCPTLLLIQNAGHFSSEFDRLTQAALPSHFARFLWRQRTRWVCRSAKTATLVTVQTRALAEAISAATNRPVHEFVVIPHGCGLTAHADTTASDRRPDHFRIGYITKFGVQKNFKTLFKAAARLRDAGYPLKIVLTLDENFAPVREVMASAEEIGITDLIENHGEVNQAKISVLYDSLDLFVFPSFCESFGFPMVEAMARGLPIVVAATNENIETTYPASLTFPPLDAEELANRLAKLMDDDSERIKRGQLSLERGRDFSWDVAARQSIIALERALSRAEVKNGQMSPTGTKVTVI